MRITVIGAIAFAFSMTSPAFAQQALVVGSCGSASYQPNDIKAVTQDTTGTLCTKAGAGAGGLSGTDVNIVSAPGLQAPGPALSANSQSILPATDSPPFPVRPTSEYPVGSIPLFNSNTGSTGSVTATLPAAGSFTSFLCGYSIRANANTVSTGDATATGLNGGTGHFTQWNAPNTSALGANEQIFKPCLPASGPNVPIVLTSYPAGAGGVVSVTIWGYRAPGNGY